MSTQTEKSTNLNLPLSQEKLDWLKSKVRDIPDFPKPGIVFKDLTTLFSDAQAFAYVLDVMAERCKQLKPDVIAGIEARGFILAPTIAYKLGLGFVPIRKPGKLPYKVEKLQYDLEYGTDTIEIHADAVSHGHRIVLIDDLLATGGTAGAARQLLTTLGGNVVGVGFIVELGFLKGRSKLSGESDVFALVNYE
ncbi:MAG TPA: adenine phosphoribosyltransferase [Trichormus sp.]|jgi:adenine phosphoribosyltransferase